MLALLLLSKQNYRVFLGFLGLYAAWSVVFSGDFQRAKRLTLKWGAIGSGGAVPGVATSGARRLDQSAGRAGQPRPQQVGAGARGRRLKRRQRLPSFSVRHRETPIRGST